MNARDYVSGVFVVRHRERERRGYVLLLGSVVWLITEIRTTADGVVTLALRAAATWRLSAQLTKT